MAKKVYSDEFKEKVTKEAQEVGNASVVARKHGISPKMVSYWVRNSKPDTAKKQFTKTVVSSNKQIRTDPKEVKEAIDQNFKLKNLLGEKEFEIAVLRDLLKKTNIPLPAR